MLFMPSGVTFYNPEKTFAGYTLWCPITAPPSGADAPNDMPGEVYLMDMRGKIVHRWKTAFPTFQAILLENGNLLCGLRTTENNAQRPGMPPYAMGGTQGWLHEYDWNGNLLFSHKDLTMHHDFKKLPNGNYMYLGWEKVPAGLHKHIRGGLKGTECEDGTIWADTVNEVDAGGKLVWQWHAYEHLDFNIDIIGPIHSRHEWTHQNTLWVTEEGDIMSSCRAMDMALKISRKTGDILWRWGNAAYLDKKSGNIEMRMNQNTFGGQHDVHVIPKGLPGAGHMLCFDNGMYKHISRAVEVDMDSREVVWQSVKDGESRTSGRIPFSSFISGARRLPNGNTLLCEGQNGRFFEVTQDKEVVWEYYRPQKDQVPSSSPWAVFRCYRYAPDYCPQFAALPPAQGEDS